MRGGTTFVFPMLLRAPPRSRLSPISGWAAAGELLLPLDAGTPPEELRAAPVQFRDLPLRRIPSGISGEPKKRRPLAEGTDRRSTAK
ncbi:MAG: hypothetical protein L3K03_05320 [Thermoplasmata archaeon]|nr:hypothetical protein [Thermoplasmata archaeon]